MDIAVNLVESYLRLNGYTTVSEMEIQARSAHGGYETLTDVDIFGFRLPGDNYIIDSDTGREHRVLAYVDDLLDLSPDTVDVIIGEVKQGEAVFNPALTRHEVLHLVLRRIEWLYRDDVRGVVERLREHGISEDPVRGGGGTIRTRLVAFGQSEKSGMHTIPIAHIVQSLVGFMQEYDDVLRSAQFREPAPGLLRLLVKSGFDVER